MQKILEKTPPHDLDSERCFLACLLFNSKNVQKAELEIQPTDFYNTLNQKLYEELLVISKKRNVDHNTFLIALKQNQALFDHATSLDLDDAVPHDESFHFYISQIKSCSLRRKQIELAYKIFNDAHQETFDTESTIDELKRVMEKARTGDETGIVQASELFTDIDNLYDKGLQHGLSTGWIHFDRYYTVKPGQITVITGIPSMGKSAWNTNLITNLAQKHHWKFAVFSPENYPMQRYCAHIAQIYSEKPFSCGFENRIQKNELEHIKFWIDEHFVFIVPRSDEMRIDNLIQKATICVLKHGVRGIVFDPWNEIDHARPQGLSETEYISKCLTKLRYFARTYQVHVWLIAHPTKLMKKLDGTYPVPTPYDISGSAHFRNKADNCLTVWRDLNNPGGNTKIYIQKIRFHEIGKIGECEFAYHIPTQSYSVLAS